MVINGGTHEMLRISAFTIMVLNGGVYSLNAHFSTILILFNIKKTLSGQIFKSKRETVIN